MWPISALKRNRYNRRYLAAWTVMLAKYTYLKLSPEQQAAVRERGRQYLVACGNASPFIRGRNSQQCFPDYVIAMKSLGIPPALEGEQWPVPDDVEMPVVKPNSWGFVSSAQHRVLRYWWNLITNYHYSDPATEAARLDLARRGVDIPDVDLGAIDDVHHFDASGKPVTWRQWWVGGTSKKTPPTGS